MRLLVLEGASLAIPEAAIESVEPGADRPGPWLADLVSGVTSAATPDRARRTLRLRGGGAVDVPAAMHIIEHAEVLELSALLRPLDADTAITGDHASIIGIIGIIELQAGLSVVLDPRALVAALPHPEADADP
jgi:hypothetical protein